MDLHRYEGRYLIAEYWMDGKQLDFAILLFHHSHRNESIGSADTV